MDTPTALRVCAAMVFLPNFAGSEGPPGPVTGFGLGLGAPFDQFLLLPVLVVPAVLFYRRRGLSLPKRSQGPRPTASAECILHEHFARGDLDRDTYLRMPGDLCDGRTSNCAQPHPTTGA